MRPSTSSSESSSSSLLPSPTTPSKPTYVRSGIGGAGNWHKASAVPPPQTHTRPTGSTNSDALLIVPSCPRSTTGCFKSGIGGAGNIHAHSERSVLDFAEELARSRAVERNTPCAYHVGIGGAGNFRTCKKRKSRRSLWTKRSEGSLRAADAVVISPVSPPASSGFDDADFGQDKGCGSAYYSTEPLPYGALDILRRRLEHTFSRGREVMASPCEKNDGLRVAGQERRLLRSHRSMWRF